MNEFTFLTIDQIFNTNNAQQLEVFRKRGAEACITDFAIVLGGYVCNADMTDRAGLKDRAGYWWTKSTSMMENPRLVS